MSRSHEKCSFFVFAVAHLLFSFFLPRWLLRRRRREPPIMSFHKKNLLLFPAICSLSVSFSFQHFHSHFFVLFFPFPSFSFLLFLQIITASFVFPPSPFFSCPKILQNLLLLCPAIDLALLHSFFFLGGAAEIHLFPSSPSRKEEKREEKPISSVSAV